MNNNQNLEKEERECMLLSSVNPLDWIADSIPDFNFPTQWVLKHLFAIFPIIIKLQITLAIK